MCGRFRDSEKSAPETLLSLARLGWQTRGFWDSCWTPGVGAHSGPHVSPRKQDSVFIADTGLILSGGGLDAGVGAQGGTLNWVLP